ncbi:hypothetical protein [Clostridium tyrobutyricum]|jgi:hypothetical protein|uniref:hypothetical protein n=1 Tax=Clostridium tyrobutyricum TaxID=1519 RepID=UPI00057C84B2|nr:hypothetical protein [Clostridium tyrobutyricum]MBR9648587.1 hypothetical protein [Clostridium tyrobutyricum]QCH27785.1 hypothetical protein EZN00_01383 [Clostridium tyrobutyricum]
MIRNEQYFIDELKKNDSYEIFMAIAKCSAEYLEKHRWVTVSEVDIQMVYKAIEKSNILKSKKLIENNINWLVNLGLIEYVTEDENPYKNNATEDEDSNRSSFYTQKKVNIESSKIKLTTHMQVSGSNVYRKICLDEEETKSLEESTNTLRSAFEEAFNEFFTPHQEEINNMQTQFTSKIQKAEKTYENIQKNLDDNIIKNIQVLSVFAGIIAILFSNIIAIKELATNGIKTIVILNLSIISALFFMIVLTRLVIINRDKKSMYICIILFALIFIALFILIK